MTCIVITEANTCPELAISCGKERAECIHPNEVRAI